MSSPRSESNRTRGSRRAPRAAGAPDRARGRPRAFDRDAVLDAALDTFWQKGYRATATRELERALGIGQSSLYNTFGSKQALLDAAVGRYEALCDRALVRPLQQCDDGLKAVDDFFVSLAAWLTQSPRRGCLLTNLMIEDAVQTPSLVGRALRYREKVRGGLRTALGRAAAQGQMADAGERVLETRADLLMGLVLGMNAAAGVGMSGREFDALASAARLEIGRWRTAPASAKRVDRHAKAR